MIFFRKNALVVPTFRDDDQLLAHIRKLLAKKLKADPYAFDGGFAKQLRKLSPGLRAMGATHHLDISLSMDDIGWHFLNFGEENHVVETELGLRTLGLAEVADIFCEAYNVVKPHLEKIEAGADYYDVMGKAGCLMRIDELTEKACVAVGENGTCNHWVAFAREHPMQVFGTQAHWH